MRVVLLALLTVGALHGHPVEDGSGLQEAPSAAAAAVAPDGSGDFKVFDKQIRAKDDGGIAVDIAHPAKDDKKTVSERNQEDSSLSNLPIEDGSGLQEKPSVDAAAPGRSDDILFKIFDSQIRAKDDGGIAIDYAHPAKDDKKAVTVKRENDVHFDCWEAYEPHYKRMIGRYWRERQLATKDTEQFPDTNPSSVRKERSADAAADTEPPQKSYNTAQTEGGCTFLRKCIDDSECSGGRCLGVSQSDCKCTNCVKYPTCSLRNDCDIYDTPSGKCDCWCQKGSCFC